MKGLRMRFHVESMTLRLQVLNLEAEEFIGLLKYAEAEENLKEVIAVGTIKDNGALFTSEVKSAEALMKKIPPKK